MKTNRASIAMKVISSPDPLRAYEARKILFGADAAGFAGEVLRRVSALLNASPTNFQTPELRKLQVAAKTDWDDTLGGD